MSEITDQVDMVCAELIEHRVTNSARTMINHLKTLIRAQERALEKAIQENTANAERADREAKNANTLALEADDLKERLEQAEKERDALKRLLNENNVAVTLRGGFDVWGAEFIQWLEKQLDTLPGLERVGKSVTDENVCIHMETQTVFVTAGILNMYCDPSEKEEAEE